MKISNLRIERKTGKSYLVADVDCSFSDEKTLWFSVDEEYEQWLTDDVYDAFMVAAIWPCMCYGEDIEIDGPVNKKLYKNLTSYIIPLIKSLREEYTPIKINCIQFKNAAKRNAIGVGTGFSGGVDSFCTIIDKFQNESDSEFRINQLFFFNIGQYGNIKDSRTLENAYAHYKVSKKFADEIKLPYVFMDSNMFEFYQPKWEYDAGPLCRISSILVFQAELMRYYVSGSYHYQQLSGFDKFYHLDDIADPFIYLMLSPDGLDIELDGSQYFRSEKTEKISSSDLAKRHLNVCVNGDLDVTQEKNCSICHKCNRTLIVLEALGLLEEFSSVFDIDKYKKQSWIYKSQIRLHYKSNPFAKDNYDFAKAQGVKMPSKLRAWLNLFPQRLAGFVHRKFK